MCPTSAPRWTGLRACPTPAPGRSRSGRSNPATRPALLGATLTTTPTQPGPYQLQAAIALVHATAPAGAEPDWTTIAGLHAALARIAPSPVVDVNHAVATGHATGPAAGLAVLAPLLRDPRYATHLPLLAAHADLLEHAGDAAAHLAWRRAADHADNPQQRVHLRRRARAGSAPPHLPSNR